MKSPRELIIQVGLTTRYSSSLYTYTKIIGHYTIEACPTFSQYKSQLLSILGLMPSFPNYVIPSMFPATIMLNILGAQDKHSHNELIKRAISIPTASLHMYGKVSKPGRKIGHVTVIANSMSQGTFFLPFSSLSF